MKPMEAWRVISANLTRYYKLCRTESFKGYVDADTEAEVICFKALQDSEKNKLHYDTIIKEFAAKLKSRCCKLTKYDEGGWDMDVYAVSIDEIDNLVNEMTEGTT